MSERERKRSVGVFLLFLILTVAYLFGHGALLLLGFSSNVGDEFWWDQTPYDKYAEDNQTKGELNIESSVLYTTHRDFVPYEDVRWWLS